MLILSHGIPVEINGHLDIRVFFHNLRDTLQRSIIGFTAFNLSVNQIVFCLVVIYKISIFFQLLCQFISHSNDRIRLLALPAVLEGFGSSVGMIDQNLLFPLFLCQGHIPFQHLFHRK